MVVFEFPNKICRALFFHRSNWWLIILLVWFAIHWRFDFAFEMGNARDALPPAILLLCYFTLSPSFFFALAGVDPYELAQLGVFGGSKMARLCARSRR